MCLAQPAVAAGADSRNVDCGASGRIEHAECAAASRHVADEAAGRHNVTGSLPVHLANDGTGGRVHEFEVDAGRRSSAHVGCWRQRHHGSTIAAGRVETVESEAC